MALNVRAIRAQSRGRRLPTREINCTMPPQERSGDLSEESVPTKKEDIVIGE
jgi:hypothetical protein